MRINEVSKKTGLTEKTIRFYEEKGLLSIQRTVTGYREYKDDHIELLLKIKLYRKCGLSIQQIKDILDDDNKLDDILYKRIEDIEEQEVESASIKELCKEVIHAKGNYKALYDTLNYLESDDYQKFNIMINDLTKPSLPKQIMFTLILIAPLLYCFIYLDMQKYQLLPYAIIGSFVSTVILTYTWMDFIKRYKYYNETFKKGISKTIIVLLVCIVGIIGIIGIFLIFATFQSNTFLVDDVFMISSSRLYLLFFLFIGVECFDIFISFVNNFFNIDVFNNHIFVLPMIKKHFLSFIVINMIMIYMGFINVSVFDSDTITCYSALNPFGEEYHYEDVESINTGFHKHGFFLREKGEFYYYITMSDGRVIKVDDIQTTSYYEEDSYSELVELDRLIMQYKPLKTGTTAYSEYLMMDDIYIERFKQIVNNK